MDKHKKTFTDKEKKALEQLSRTVFLAAASLGLPVICAGVVWRRGEKRDAPPVEGDIWIDVAEEAYSCVVSPHKGYAEAMAETLDKAVQNEEFYVDEREGGRTQ